MATATDQIYVQILTETQKSIKNLGDYIAKMAATYLSVKALVGLVKDSIRAYIQEEESIAKLGAALKITGQYSKGAMIEMNALAASLQNTTIYADDVARAAQGILMQLSGLTTKGIQKIMPLIADFASSMGLDLVQAAELVGKTLGGTTNMLGRYGIRLSESEDPQQRLNELLGEMNEKFGGMAETMAKTTGGQMQQFINLVGDLKESLGSLLVEVLNPVVGKLAEMAKAIISYRSATAILKTPTSALTSVEEIKAAIETLTKYRDVVLAAQLAGGQHIATTEALVRQVNEYLFKLNRTLMVLPSTIKESDKATGDFVRNTTKNVEILVDEMYKYWTMFDEMNRLFGPAPSALGGKVKQSSITPLVDGTEILIEKTYEYRTQLNKISEQYVALYGKISDIEKPMMSLNDIQKLMVEKWKPIEDSVKKIGAEIAMIGATFGDMFASGNIESGIKRIMSHMIDLTTQACIYAAAASVPNWPMVAFFLGLAGITAFGGAALQSFITKTPNIPGMASGGIVTKPTLALVGESGPEAIVPLGKSAGGVTVNVYGSIWQTEDLARAVANKMGRW